MEITISSRGTRMSPNLEEMVKDKVNRLDRLLNGLDRAVVHLFEERNPRISDKDVCEIQVGGNGRYVHCKASGPDTMTAVERTVHKAERGLRKLKTKEVNRHHHSGGRVDKHQEAVPIVIPDAADVEFVREKQIVNAPITALEAVQQMEVLGHDFFLFTSAETQQAAVVYRRKAGDYGLLEHAEPIQ